MQKNIYIILFLVVASYVKAQNKSAKMFVKVIGYEKWFDDIRIQLAFTGENIKLPFVGFEHLTPTYTISPVTNSRHILYEKQEMSLMVDENNTKNGKTSFKSEVKIPKDVIFNDGDLVLTVSFHSRQNGHFKISSEPFSWKDINAKIDNKIKPTEIKMENLIIHSNKRGAVFDFKLTSNTSMGNTLIAKMYANGTICSQEIRAHVATGNKVDVRIFFPYTAIYLPKGDHKITYEIVAQSGDYINKELAKGVIDITQPQLYWLHFKSSEVDIDVSEMDPHSVVGQIFSRTGGRGLGDAFYSLHNASEELYSSPHVKRSGAIRDVKDKIQTYQHDKLKIRFWDKDVFANDLMEEMDVELKYPGEHVHEIRNYGRIRRFKFIYRLEAVNIQNYKK